MEVVKGQSGLALAGIPISLQSSKSRSVDSGKGRGERRDEVDAKPAKSIRSKCLSSAQRKRALYLSVTLESRHDRVTEAQRSIQLELRVAGRAGRCCQSGARYASPSISAI